MLRPSPLTPGKDPRYVLYKRLIRPQGRAGRVSTRRKSLSSTGFRTPHRPACSESLYRQHYPGSLQNCKVIIFIIFMLLPLFLPDLIWLIPFNVSKQLVAFIRLVGPLSDRLCGLVVRVSGYRYRGLGFDPRCYQIF
jgi:hypothetical protein